MRIFMLRASRVSSVRLMTFSYAALARFISSSGLLRLKKNMDSPRKKVSVDLKLLSELFHNGRQDLADPGFTDAENLTDLFEIELFDIV